MRWRQFSLKQLLISMAGICVGFGGIAFAWQPIEVPLDPAYDTLANMLPAAQLLALVTGSVIMGLAVIPLFTSRRPVSLLILILLGISLGLFLGALIAMFAKPYYRYLGAVVEQRLSDKLLFFASAAIGGLLPLVFVAWFDFIAGRRKDAKRTCSRPDSISED